MDTVTININPDLLYRRTPIWRVETKDSWFVEWSVEPYLYCNHLRLACAPAGSSAELEYRYGYGMRAGERTMDQVEAPDLLGKWVKVTAFADFVAEYNDTPLFPPFVGLVIEDADAQAGVSEGIESGLHTFTARGPEWLLTRKKLIRSQVSVAPLDDQPYSEIEVGRAIAFNGGKGTGRDSSVTAQPNRSAGRGNNGSYIFALSIGEGGGEELWSARDILEYLLGYQAPQGGGNEQIPWAVAAPEEGSDVAMLDLRHPQLADVDSRTLADVVSMLVDPRRASCWWVQVDCSVEPNVCKLFVAALNDEPIELPTATIEPNGRQVSLVLDTDPAGKTVEVIESISDTYDRLICRGSPIGCCCTISVADGTLEADWTTDDETAFLAAASGEGDYPAGDLDRAFRNDALRQQDFLKRVYSYFRLAAGFDGHVPDKDGNRHVVIPAPESLDDPDSADPDAFWYPGLRFENSLPLLECHDYSGDNIFADDVPNTLPQNALPQYLRPLVLIRTGPSDAYYYAQVEKLGSYKFNFSFSVQPQENGPGFVLAAHGRLPQALAVADFNAYPPGTVNAAATNYNGGPLDWRDLKATVFMASDRNLEISIPAAPSPSADAERLLVIDAPAYRFDYVVPGTIVGLRDYALLYSDTGGAVRDDRDMLTALANVAWQWYSMSRQALHLSFRGTSGQIWLGQLVVDYLSVVTSVAYDVKQNTTTIHTQFGELDAAGLFDPVMTSQR